MPDYRDTLGAVMNNLGILYRDLGRPEEAVDALRAAVDIRRKLIDETPGNRHYLLRLGSSFANLGDALRKRSPVRRSPPTAKRQPPMRSCFASSLPKRLGSEI